MARVSSQILSTELISLLFPPFLLPQSPCLYFPNCWPPFPPTISQYFFPLLACISSHFLPIFLHTPCMYFFPLSLLYFSTPTPSTPGFPPAPCIPPAPPRTFYQFLAPIVFSISTDNLEIGQIQENSSTTVSSADPGPLYSKLRSIPLSILAQKGLNSTKRFDTQCGKNMHTESQSQSY